MIYVFKSLREMALMLRDQAARAESLSNSISSRRMKHQYTGERNAYLYAAEVVFDAVVEDVALMDEYRVAYAEAQVQLASTFWQLLKAGGVAVACYGVDKGWAAP